MRNPVLFISFALFAAAPAFAQTGTNDAGNVDDVRQNSSIHGGPFYLRPTVLLKQLGIDTNVFNAAGDQQSDFTFTLTPQTDVAVPLARRGLLKATVGTDLVYYSKYDSERSLDPQFRVRGEVYAHRLTLFAEDAYLSTRQRPNFEIDIRSRHRENDLVAGGKLHLTPKFSLELGARRGEARYDADAFFSGTSLQRTLNRKTSGLVGAVRHNITPLTSVGVRFDRLSDAFTYSPLRDSQSYRVMPGVEFKPKALISGTAWVGYRKFTPVNPGQLPGFSGLVADLGLSYTLLGSTTFGASYRRDLTYSYEERQPFFLENSIGASVRRALGGKFDTIVSADRHRYDYRDMIDLDAAQAPDQRADTTWVYGANIGYRVRRTSRIGFGASYYTRDSNRVTFVQFDGLRFGATVNYGF